MFAVSFATIFACYPELDPERVIIEHSFGHSIEKLSTIDYLTRDQMQFINHKILIQWRDASYNVHRWKDKLAISGMFKVEIKFAADALLKRFNVKIKSNRRVLDPFTKMEYQKENPILIKW